MCCNCVNCQNLLTDLLFWKINNECKVQCSRLYFTSDFNTTVISNCNVFFQIFFPIDLKFVLIVLNFVTGKMHCENHLYCTFLSKNTALSYKNTQNIPHYSCTFQSFFLPKTFCTIFHLFLHCTRCPVIITVSGSFPLRQKEQLVKQNCSTVKKCHNFLPRAHEFK